MLALNTLEKIDGDVIATKRDMEGSFDLEYAKFLM